MEGPLATWAGDSIAGDLLAWCDDVQSEAAEHAHRIRAGETTFPEDVATILASLGRIGAECRRIRAAAAAA